ncbi:hypothetical protein BDW72DRAFT_170384 [Aspergillus terricola var. indicus]
MCASLVLHLGLPVNISSDIGAVIPEPASLPPESRTRHTRLRTWDSAANLSWLTIIGAEVYDR